MPDTGKILIVCTMGAGSSQLLRMNVEAAIKQLGFTGVKVEVCDAGTARSVRCDGIITTVTHAEVVRGHPTARAYAAVKGTFDMLDIRQKTADMLRQLGIVPNQQQPEPRTG